MADRLAAFGGGMAHQDGRGGGKGRAEAARGRGVIRDVCIGEIAEAARAESGKETLLGALKDLFL